MIGFSLKRLLPEKTGGFTITELMVTVAIIGILAASATGTYVAMRPTLNMHTFGRDLIASSQLARLEAVKRNTCTGLVFVPAAAPPADLTGVANKGSYWVFTDDGVGGGTACDAQMQPGEQAHPRFPARQHFVPDGVAFTPSPQVTTAADLDAGNLFTRISFTPRSLVDPDTNFVGIGGQAILIRNDPNPANATWWGRVVVNNLGGAMEYQTNNNPANEGNWSE